MAGMEIAHVGKHYGGFEALRDVNIEIGDGEFVVLVGPSGCGKSTLLRMIAGLETIDSGEIRIGDRLINFLEPKDRDIAMVFQNYALYPHKTVSQNMSFALRLKGVGAAEIETQVRKAAGLLGLGDMLDRYPRHLSGGQRQRVAMGRAIVRDPQAFLFDEPLSNLDAKLRVHMRSEIKALHARLRTTSVFVTHDQVEAMTMAERIVVMNAGHVEQIGTPLELYDRPVNAFVALFIGSPSMNVIDGVVTVRDGRAMADLPGGARIPLPPAARARDGAAIRLGVRPEHLARADDEPGIDATVETLEPTGAETFVTCAVGTERIVVRFNDRPDLRTGQPVRLAPDLSRVHVFSAESGERL
jgi:multiple sugar transport system ATP-binding protein